MSLNPPDKYAIAKARNRFFLAAAALVLAGFIGWQSIQSHETAVTFVKAAYAPGLLRLERTVEATSQLNTAWVVVIAVLVVLGALTIYLYRSWRKARAGIA